jgi:hypothetical protein
MYTVVFWFLNKQKINNTSQLAIIANDRLRAQGQLSLSLSLSQI